MLDVASLKAEMTRCGHTQDSLSNALGITSRTFRNKMKSGDFGCKEIEIIIRELKLKNPMSIFFADKVT